MFHAYKDSAMSYAFSRNTFRSPRSYAVPALVLCAAFAVPAIFAAAAPSAPTVDLNIAKFAFAPKEITIAPGTKIVWTNRDETPHTVTSNDKFEHIFTSEGDFGYICTVHPFMTGVVHVRKQ